MRASTLLASYFSWMKEYKLIFKKYLRKYNKLFFLLEWSSGLNSTESSLMKTHMWPVSLLWFSSSSSPSSYIYTVSSHVNSYPLERHLDGAQEPDSKSPSYTFFLLSFKLNFKKQKSKKELRVFSRPFALLLICIIGICQQHWRQGFFFNIKTCTLKE